MLIFFRELSKKESVEREPSKRELSEGEPFEREPSKREFSERENSKETFERIMERSFCIIFSVLYNSPFVLFSVFIEKKYRNEVIYGQDYTLFSHLPMVLYTLFSVLAFAYFTYLPSPDEITLYSTETVGKLLFGPALITFARLFTTEIYEIFEIFGILKFFKKFFKNLFCCTSEPQPKPKSNFDFEVAFWFILIGLSHLILLLIVLVCFIIIL